MTTTTSQKNRFDIQGPIHAKWMVAPCERYTLVDYRLVRGSKFMEYSFEEAPSFNVELARWVPGEQPHQVDTIEEEGNLQELGGLAFGPKEKLVKWVSKHGLLGFRNVGRKLPLQLGLTYWIIPGTGRFHGPGHQFGYAYEPLDLISNAATVARAATAVYTALRKRDGQEREVAIRELIRMNHGTLIDDQIEMRVLGVPIRSFLREPHSSVQWTMLGSEVLPDLIDQYLANEFTLCWSGPRGLTRNITCAWNVHSLLGALFLKLANRVREARKCVVCSKPLASSVRRDAKTCSSSACRKRRERNPKKYEGVASCDL